jgi:hypothetical protein
LDAETKLLAAELAQMARTVELSAFPEAASDVAGVLVAVALSSRGYDDWQVLVGGRAATAGEHVIALDLEHHVEKRTAYLTN